MKRKPPREKGKYLLYAFCIVIFAFMLFPAMVVIPISFSPLTTLRFPPPSLSFRWYRDFFFSPAWLDATFMSIRVALVVAVVATVLGTLASLGLTKASFRGQRIVKSLMIMPLIVPDIVKALGVYSFFLHVNLTGSLVGFVLAHTFQAIPFVFLNVSAVMQTVDPSLERAARSLGANSLQAFWKVKLPLIKSGIIAGMFFAFIISFDELIIAMFLSTPKIITLPVKMWDGIRMELTPTITAASSLLITSSALLFSMIVLTTRRRARIGKTGLADSFEG